MQFDLVENVNPFISGKQLDGLVHRKGFALRNEGISNV
jgi:hypothetical protein